MSSGAQETGGMSAGARTGLAAGGCGCIGLPVLLVVGASSIIVLGGFGVIFAPLIALILLFTGGGSPPSPQQSDIDAITQAFQGEGDAPFDTNSVKPDLVQPIKDGGGICKPVTPVIIAAQIEVASNFQPNLTGPDGAQGISQLPPDIFKQFGQDDDKNGSTSAFDVEDSIMAQGRYMCSLSDSVNKLISDNEAVGDPLDLTLAAYKDGLAAVTTAKAIPADNAAQGYVTQIRSLFAKYEGIGSPGGPGQETPAPGQSADNAKSNSQHKE
jgi:hypothetical protein